MIRVYDATEMKFNHNGIKVLKPLFAEITKVKDGDYYIEIEDLIDNFEYYQKGMIISANTPKTWGEKDFQCFRCDNPRVENNRVYCKAWHLYYDSKNFVIDGHKTLYGTCDEAIKAYKNDVDGAYNGKVVICPFSETTISTMSSNIMGEKDTEIEDVSLYGAIEYLRDVYLGTLVRDNFNVAINQSIGEDRGVVLAYKKNITDMNAEENWDDVCTKILPYTMVGDTKITLNVKDYDFEPFVKLEDIGEDNPYNIPYAKIVEFKYEEKEGESAPTSTSKWREWLYAEASNYLRVNKFPKVNYKVSANIDNVSDVGDIIHIKHPKIITNDYLKSTVISVKYDAIRGKYTEIEFGNFRRAIKNLLSETTALKGEIAKVTQSIGGASSAYDLLTNDKVIYRGSDILIVDTLPAEQATNCYRISDTGISFSSTGINGTFTRVIGFNGTIDLGGASNVGKTNIYNESGSLSASMDKDGLILYSSGNCLQIGSVLSGSNHKLRIRQKSGDTWGEWRNLQEEGTASGASKEVVLFDGIGSYNKVTLKQSINNTDYSAIEIFYGIFTTGYDGNTFDHYQSVKVSVPVGKKVSLVSSAIDANDGVTIGVGIVEIASDVITFKKNNAYKGSNMATTSNKNLVYIRKVIGYKV